MMSPEDIKKAIFELGLFCPNPSHYQNWLNQIRSYIDQLEDEVEHLSVAANHNAQAALATMECFKEEKARADRYYKLLEWFRDNSDVFPPNANISNFSTEDPLWTPRVEGGDY